MGLFDYIRHRLHPEVRKAFEINYKNNKDAIGSFIVNSNIYNGTNLSFIHELHTIDKIEAGYKKLYQEINNLFKSELPTKFTFKQQCFINSNISIIKDTYYCYLEEKKLYDQLIQIKNNYPNAYLEYCDNNNINKEILTHTERTTISDDIQELAKREKEILEKIKHEKIASDFKEKVVRYYRHCYKDFHEDITSDKGKEYILNHLDDLEAFKRIYAYPPLLYYAESYLPWLRSSLTQFVSVVR